MSFTGKATFSAGTTLPEIAEDVSDIIAIISPYETPLLDVIGDSQKSATSTVHEWLEDSLLPNTDQLASGIINNPTTTTELTVFNGSRFRIGDQISIVNKEDEVMLVTAIDDNELTVTRGYGGTTAVAVSGSDNVRILGNAALEGADADNARFTNRTRKQNYTQIFSSTVEVSGSQLASQTLALADEMEFQKSERLRELLRDLENCVINGVAAASNPQGSTTVRRTMQGIRQAITTNTFEPGTGNIPDGGGSNDDQLNEAVLNAALRSIWKNSSATIDTIVCGGLQKRRINQFVSTNQRFIEHDDTYKSMVDVYESDFGICRVVMSRWVPADTLLLLDSSRIDLLPLSGRSFQFKPLARTGDSEIGQVIGEYTLEFRNENAHGIISGLDVSS